MDLIIEEFLNNGYECNYSDDNTAWSLSKNNIRIDIVKYNNEISIFKNGWN